MSTCLFCSTIRSSSSLISEPNCRWPTTTNPNTSRPVQFALRKHVNRNNSRGIARVFQEEGVGVLFPDESVSLREIDAGEGRDVDGGVGGGVAEAVEETEGALGLTKDSPPPGRYVRKREEYAEEDRFESRFKLRNGKEVCSFDTFVLFLGGGENAIKTQLRTQLCRNSSMYMGMYQMAPGTVMSGVVLWSFVPSATSMQFSIEKFEGCV